MEICIVKQSIVIMVVGVIMFLKLYIVINTSVRFCGATMHKYFFILLIFNLIIKNIFCGDTSDFLEKKYGPIIHSTVIFRHGHRSPYRTYPNDPHKNYGWENGFGQLTNQGKKRLYEVGHWFRDKYQHLTGPKYSRKKFYLLSSDLDRALMSAACFLAGYFPPTESEVWNPNLAWQPIPIHSIPSENDNLLHFSKTLCPRYNNDFYGLSKLPEFQELRNKYRDVMNYAEVHSGKNFSNENMINNLNELSLLHDALLTEEENGLQIPEWAKKIYPQPLGTLTLMRFRSHFHTTVLKRLKAGPILQSVHTDLMNRIKEKNEIRLKIYSAHDTTIIGIMMTLNVFNNIMPPYGAALIFELRKKDSQHFITTMYKNCSFQPPYFLPIPECTEDCTFDKFAKIIEPFIPQNWKSECKIV